MTWTEEEGPCVRHRSLFDTEPPPAIRCAPTEPCPPSFACDDAAPTPLVTRVEPDSDGFNPAACHGVTHGGFESVTVLKDSTLHLSALGLAKLAEHGVALPATLTFEGGDVAVVRPTREALLLSAKQWATAVREEWIDSYNDLEPPAPAHAVRLLAKLDRLDAVLAELAAL